MFSRKNFNKLIKVFLLILSLNVAKIVCTINSVLNLLVVNDVGEVYESPTKYSIDDSMYFCMLK
jgi:hypothetical protein